MAKKDRTWIRIQDGVAADTFTSDGSIQPGVDVLVGIGEWVEITGAEAPPSSGWLYVDGQFSPPPEPAPAPVPAQPSKSELMAQIEALMARVAALPDEAA